MAEALPKDAEAYAKERESFFRDLQHFHETRGTPFRRVPKISGHEIDLYLLYSLVTAQGGWIKVNYRNLWPELFVPLSIPRNCVNASIALKQIYLRYLDRWEKVHFLGEEAERGSDDDDESRHKRWSARALHSVPHSYNYQQHNITDSTREYNHLSAELYKASDYDRLALSLLSPLPNEQDFAINVCTLLSNDGKHTLKLERHPRLLDYLLAHAGVFHHRSLRNLTVDTYENIRKQNMNTFWKETVCSEEFLDLTNELLFVNNNRAESKPNDVVPILDLTNVLPTTASTVPEPPSETAERCDTDSDAELFASEDCVINNMPKGKGFKLKFKLDASDRDIFNLGRNVGTRDYMGQRVLQVAAILRNLSFFEENVPILVNNQTFLRFMLLCASSRWNQLMNLGMEMLGNMALDFLVKDAVNDKIASSLLKVVTEGIKTDDRNWCITGLEVLNKLSQNEANEDALLRTLESSVYERVCSFLTIHDVMLLIYTLECLYSLSSLGERACNFISNTYGVIDTLVSLVTVEGKSYGPKACIGMKLVETLTGTVTPPVTSTPTSSTVTPSASATTTTSVTTISSTIATPSAPTATPVQTTSATTPVKMSTLATPQRPSQMVPQRLATISPVTPTSAVQSPMSTTTTLSNQSNPQHLQQKHAHQQAIQENEHFALSWLRATYEPCSNGRVEHQELYKQYINSCAKIGRRGVIAPLHFPRIVRSVFGGTVGPNPDKSSGNAGSEAQYYDGIKVRAQQLVLNVQSTTTTTSTTTSTNTTFLHAITPTTPLKAVRRKSSQSHSQSDTKATLLSVVSDSLETPPTSPASPILKAQLSAPPKMPSNKADGSLKSQVMAHPHLSQALLGSGCASQAQGQAATVVKDQGQSSTSLIKSLLATKVNECMNNPVSMRTDCQSVAQVAARQQRLLAQQTQTPDSKVFKMENSKNSRLNGARQLFTDPDLGESAVSSTTHSLASQNRREPPQPPPPLAPLSAKAKLNDKIENEDSDSIGNNSLASSTGIGNIGIGGISSTEDGDNSLTSFEGLLNGIPSIDNTICINDDSNSKDSLKNLTSMKKPLMLADLLEKKVDKEPIMNGVMGKELRIGDRGLELVENHIDKALNKLQDSSESMKRSVIVEPKENSIEIRIDETDKSLKRPAADDVVECEPKKPHLSTNNLNGNASSSADSPAPESVSSSNGDEGVVTASTAAAKLFADLAADILEDEEDELMEQQQVVEEAPSVPTPTPVQQVFVDNNQVLMAQPRQIIVSQPAGSQVVIPAGTQLKTQTGQTVIVQNTTTQPRSIAPVVPSNLGQIVLSQGLPGCVPGQMQLVPSGQPGQYVIQTGGSQSYMVAQQQTAVVHGQPQTVLVAQQQGTSTKTIIILQQNSPSATHHQKVVMTPQGQQMVVTQVPRPIMQHSQQQQHQHHQPHSTQTAAALNAVTTVAKTTVITTVSQSTSTTSNGVINLPEKKPEPTVRKKSSRDLSTPFVCEWGDCYVATKFKSANQVYMHVCEAHIPDTNDELLCQWERCDNMKRKRFSLMTHINDKHCNLEAMKTSLIKRKQFLHTGKIDPPAPAPTTQHPGYAPDAAFHAIKRHALEFVNPKELQRTAVKQGSVPASLPRTGPPPSDQDDNEGPVTKSIRLTASLILRNLVIYSSNCRRYLKHYEPHLANVALSNVESSRTIAQVLYDMNDCSNHR